jgi:hypothetical protein
MADDYAAHTGLGDVDMLADVMDGAEVTVLSNVGGELNDALNGLRAEMGSKR